jgi:hypothetical protein
LPAAWNAEKKDVNCTVRFVDPYDHRFQSLREGMVREIQIVNTATKDAFNRKLRAYREFEITINTNAGFTHPTPGTEKAHKVLMAKIVWWDEPGFIAGHQGEYFREGI